MDIRFMAIAAAAILTGCCSCPTPCPSLVNNPNGVCPYCKSGCSNCVPTVDVTEYSVPASGRLFGYEDSKMQVYWLQASPVTRAKTNDNYVKVQVPVKNLTVSPMQLKYKFNWLDKDGNAIKDLDHNHWESVALVPGGDGRISSIAPEQGCNDYELRVRYVP